MAIKQVVYSDISGKQVAEAARIVVSEHPLLAGGAVELDVSVAEAQKLTVTKIDLVSLQIFEPGSPARRVVMDAAAFAQVFKGVDMEAVLAAARRVEPSGSEPIRRTRGKGKVKGGRGQTVAGEKRDYTSDEWFGVLHRGKVTEEEALMVRSNLDRANQNREREGQSLIDSADPKEKARYRFS